MAEIKDYSSTAGDNSSASPDGAPEGMAPSGVNNTMREMMARMKRMVVETLTVDSTTDTTSATTGSIQTDGGMGIVKSLWVGLTSRFVGAATFDAVVSVDDTTDSTSTTTGSIHTDGGLGVAKDIIAGAAVTVATNATLTNGDLTLSEGKIAVTNTANESALAITSSATTAIPVVDISGAALTTAVGLGMQNFDALTTGAIATFQSNSGSTGTRHLVQIKNNNTAAVNTTALQIIQDAAQRALWIDQNGNDASLEIDSEATTTNIMDVSGAPLTTGRGLAMQDFDGLTTGRIATFQSNSASTGTRHLVLLKNNHTAAVNATVLAVIQDAANEAMLVEQNADSAFINFTGTAGASHTNPISTHGTAGAQYGWAQIQINGAKKWIKIYEDPSA